MNSKTKTFAAILAMASFAEALNTPDTYSGSKKRKKIKYITKNKEIIQKGNKYIIDKGQIVNIETSTSQVIYALNKKNAIRKYNKLSITKKV